MDTLILIKDTTAICGKLNCAHCCSSATEWGSIVISVALIIAVTIIFYLLLTFFERKREFEFMCCLRTRKDKDSTQKETNREDKTQDK
jgi:hypothetical protein